MAAEAWPPRSPMKALLSSPSGRRRYRDFQDQDSTATSSDNLLGSPSLLEKLRAARADRDHEILQADSSYGGDAADEEDEETLQLKLQAIEAKLKLKKLQQQRARAAGITRHATAEVTTGSASGSRFEIALSPIKKTIAPSLPKSPSRVLLGIDKGWQASDVSLKRARIVNGSPVKQRRTDAEPYVPKRPSIFTQCRPSSSSSALSAVPAKSFSERMSDMRDRDTDREKQAMAVRDSRSSRFRLDKTEMETFQQASDVFKTPAPRSAREASNGDRGKQSPSTRSIKPSHSMPSLRSTSPSKTSSSHVHIQSSTSDDKRGDPSLYEGFSGTHLSSRILPHTFLKRTLPADQFTNYTIPTLLKNVTSPEYLVPDGVGDYVVFGIIANISSPFSHKSSRADTNTTSSKDWQKKWNDGSDNSQKFMIMTLTDLKWTIDLFLFDQAVPRYHRLTTGTLIAILNPGIMPPKKGREDTGAFSLTLNNGEDQVLEIGKAKHLGYCNAKKKDGQECSQWVDASKTTICEFHLNAQINRARGGRAGINSMDGWQSNRAEKKQQSKHGFDAETQSFYYTVGGAAPKNPGNHRFSYAPTGNSSLSTAKLIDRNGDDPFLAEGQMLERDKQDRLRKRMEAMAHEHEIARKLGGFTGSAGGQYMRSRTADEASTSRATGLSAAGSNGFTKDDVLADAIGGKRKKRAADSVRLSPVKKKTRFLTETGIKVAGRESIGGDDTKHLQGTPNEQADMHDDTDDDDDDLDIV